MLEREMRNKSGPSLSGNLRHFHKTLFSLLPLKVLGEKQAVVSPPTPFLRIQFGSLHVLSLVPSV